MTTAQAIQSDLKKPSDNFDKLLEYLGKAATIEGTQKGLRHWRADSTGLMLLDCQASLALISQLEF